MTTERHSAARGGLAALALAGALAGCGGTAAPSPTRTHAPAVPVLHLGTDDQGRICAGINAMVFAGTANPFDTEVSVTAGMYHVGSAEASAAVATAIRARCPNHASVIPAGQ